MTIYFPGEETSFPERAFKCVENWENKLITELSKRNLIPTPSFLLVDFQLKEELFLLFIELLGEMSIFHN